jgi:glycine cleavage system H protein
MHMGVPTDRRYLSSHEWAKPDDGSVLVGITAFAVEALQDLVFIELPEVGGKVTAGESFGEIESVKAVSDLMAPISGEVTAVNEAVSDDLEILLGDAYEAGWMIRIQPEGDAAAELEEMLDAEVYDKLCAEQDH